LKGDWSGFCAENRLDATITKQGNRFGTQTCITSRNKHSEKANNR